MRIITDIKTINRIDDYYELKTNDADIRIWFMTDSIIRIRVGFDGDFDEESYSLVTTAWEDRLDGVVGPRKNRIKVAKTELCDEADIATITSDTLGLVIHKSPAIIEVYDNGDTLIHRDIPKLAYRCDSNNRRIHTSEIQEGDCFYGFGEKTGNINKYHQLLTMSPGDTVGYDPINADSLYKHIPFYIKANKINQTACGYFYHNMSECTFDMGRKHSNYWQRHSTYTVDSGDIDLFFMYGPTIKDVVKEYTFLTGRSAMLPGYALGYLGSSMYYSELKENCDDKIIKFLDTAKKEDIPIDGFQLSSGYTAQNTTAGEKRCVFTWNKERFKNPSEFFKEAKKRGVIVSPNVKPGILLTHPNIDEFTSKDMLVNDSFGDSYEVGEWWGGEGVFADFTNPTCRREWKKMLKENVIMKGTPSVWNDNCEYDSIVDKDAKVNFDGKGSTIGASRSIQANIMCQITSDAIMEEYPNTRPYIVCRGGHSGIQRIAQSWAGDNRTSWDTLKYNQATILGMSLSGVSNYGGDIGGFYGGAPSPELLVRWVQAGIFMPRFSIHSVNADNTVTEPWMYPEYTHYIRDAIKFRYRLFPYLYSLMAASHENGDMIMNPLMAAFPEDERTYDSSDSYVLGNSLLVANVLDKGIDNLEVMLPAGSKFYEMSYEKGCVGANLYEGGNDITIPVELGTIPLFLLSGAIVPLAGNELSNLSLDTLTSLHIICVADKDSHFTYYEDDGVSLDYENGVYHKMDISIESDVKTIISFSNEGKYKSTIEDMELEVISNYNCPINIAVDDKTIPQFLRRDEYESATSGWYYNIECNTTFIKYPYIQEDNKVIIDYGDFDMLGM